MSKRFTDAIEVSYLNTKGKWTAMGSERVIRLALGNATLTIRADPFPIEQNPAFSMHLLAESGYDVMHIEPNAANAIKIRAATVPKEEM